MAIVGSKRAKELREQLAQQFQLDESTISRALVALVGAIRERLPRPVEVSLASWIPEAWTLLEANAAACRPARGPEQLKQRMVGAGIPSDLAGPFVVAVFAYLGDRCGMPLRQAVMRRIQEVELLERETGPSARA